MTMTPKEKAVEILRQMLGQGAQFRPGQWEAIEAVIVNKQKCLVVQRTGWGKSLVYFIATKLLRDEGSGPTLIISPLLSLMRNQILMADRIQLRALTINSNNQGEWDAIEEQLASNNCDLLFISPERLNNPRFQTTVLPKVGGKIGLFVVDEAHCISDWGHDFRPDYRRIVRILKMLPKNIPVMGTTATANNRVIADIQAQLGLDLTLLRGPLQRDSLRLQNINLPTQSGRLAWLAENLPKFKGSGIIYCLTIADTNKVADFLIQRGFLVAPYHGGKDLGTDREALENQFLNNEIQILVATVALGMGFDKPDIAFVIHFQSPGSVIAYYQQVGRAGRSLDKSYGILLAGEEDAEIHEYFANSAFPPSYVFESILSALEKTDVLSKNELLSIVNTKLSILETALNLLEVDGAISRDANIGKYSRTLTPWVIDRERIDRVSEVRQAELLQMGAYQTHSGCLMKFLLNALDDPAATDCGKCANCRGKGLKPEVDPALLSQAQSFLDSLIIPISPREYIPINTGSSGSQKIPESLQLCEGRSLCNYRDQGLGELVIEGKYTNTHFSEELVHLAASYIRKTWAPDPFPEWVVAIPSLNHRELVPDFTQRLAKKLGLPYYQVLVQTHQREPQKSMQNSFLQARNVMESLGVRGKVPNKPVLLVDDIVDSRWTLTIAGYYLRQAGSGIVYPFTLAKATGGL